jgi:diapolycopene oxygenase
MNTHKALVIGSGIGGIASAIRLARKGYEVTVLEKNGYPGGKLGEFVQDGFRFDAGPSLFTLPDLVDELFRLCGENPQDHFSYQRLSVNCNYFWDDGTFLPAWSDETQFAEEVERRLGVPSSRVSNYLAKSKFIYDTTAPVFLQMSLHRLANFLHLKTLKGIIRMPFLGIFSTLHNRNKQQLGDPKLVQLFDRYATYNGSNPYQAPGVLQSIPHLEFGIGAYFPEGGMHRITSELVALAKRTGVHFRYNAEVTRINYSGKTVSGVQFGKERLDASIVVCNSDIVPAYRRLLPDLVAPEKILTQPRSTSALIFYWGISKVFTELELHNIFFSADYTHEFAELAKGEGICDDPTVYLNISSVLQKSDAPDGCQNWFILINVPSNIGQDWEKIIRKARQSVFSKLGKLLGEPIERLIVTERILDPIKLETTTSSFQGALYGSSSNNRYAAFLRHSNFSGSIKGLYFCGGSVHPGGGIPLCLQSAKIVADLIPKL